MAENKKKRPRKTSEEERFWMKVDKTKTCWLWTASKNSLGYGRFKFQGKTGGAHRYSYLLVNGPIPDGLCVCHKCDVRACVNPKHLWLGTISDNAKDMVSKNRHNWRARPQTHCKYGHEYALVGLYITNGKSGYKRTCKECFKNKEKRIRENPKRLAAREKYQKGYRERTRHPRAKPSVGGQTDKATDF